MKEVARKVHRGFWPTTSIALSSWEAFALISGKPTVTDISRTLRRHPAGKVVIATWTLGLLYHLLISRAD